MASYYLRTYNSHCARGKTKPASWLKIPFLNGIEIAYLLKERVPESKVILVTVYESENCWGAGSVAASAVSKTEGLEDWWLAFDE